MVFVWKGIRKNIISYYSSTFTIKTTITTPKFTLRSVLSLEVKASVLNVTRYLTFLNAVVLFYCNARLLKGRLVLIQD